MHIEEIPYKDSRIKILTDKKRLVRVAYNELVRQRGLIEELIKENKFFKEAMEPLAVTDDAPEIVKLMAEAGKIANVGPNVAMMTTSTSFDASVKPFFD